MTEDVKCLCGSPRATLLHRGVRHDPSATVWQCSDCQLVFTWPRPSEDELSRYYEEQYRSEYGAVPPHRLRQNGAADNEARTARLSSLLLASTSVLDVGAGPGGFVDAIRERVASVTAIEPDEQSRSSIMEELAAPALSSLGDLPRDGRFDLITAFHVVEHSPDPLAFLLDLRRFLRPAGSLVVEVPNIDDALVSVYASEAYRAFYFQKAHLFYFSGATLARLAGDAGLTGKIEFVQRYGLRNHLHWLGAGEADGDRLYTDVVLAPADAAYRASLIESGHADTLWLVARADATAD